MTCSGCTKILYGFTQSCFEISNNHEADPKWQACRRTFQSSNLTRRVKFWLANPHYDVRKASQETLAPGAGEHRVENRHLLGMDERHDINERKIVLEKLAVRGRRVLPRNKRVRFADEQRLRNPLTIAIVVLGGLFLMLGVLGRWGLWIGAVKSQVIGHPISPGHEVPGVAALPYMSAPTRAVSAVRHWLEVTRRQTPSDGNASGTVPLQTFQVDTPLLGAGGAVVGAGTPDGFEGIDTTVAQGDNGAAAGCQVTLGVNVFSNSFGSPFVGDYTPPDCLGDSNTVVMNLTVKSSGRQFDRLAIV